MSASTKGVSEGDIPLSPHLSAQDTPTVEISAKEISTASVSAPGAAVEPVPFDGYVMAGHTMNGKGESSPLSPDIAMLLAQSMQYVRDAVKLVRYHNGQFIFHYINHSAHRLFQELGFQPASFLQKTPTECFTTNYAHTIIGQYAIVAETKQEKTFDMSFQDLQGNVRYFHWQLVPIKNEHDEVLFIISMIRDISEQRYFRKYQQRMATMLENSPSMVMFADVSSSLAIYFFNPAAFQALVAQEQSGRTFSPHDFFDSPNILDGVIFPSVQSDDIWKGDCTLRSLDGRIFSASVIVMALRKEDGSIEEYIFICIDKTEQKNAQERLLESERLARLIIENIQQYAFVRLDLRGTITSWNQGAERIFEYDADAVIGRHVGVLEPTSTSIGNPSGFIGGFTDSLLEQALEAQEIFYESRRISSSGRVFYTENTLTALFNHAGRHIGYSLIVHDVSVVKRMKEELRRKRREADIFVENASDMIVRFNSQKVCVYANRMVETVFIASRGVIVGLSIEDMMQANPNIDNINNLLDHVRETGNEAHISASYDTPQGKLTFAIKAIPEFDEQNRLETIVVVAANITTEIAAQELLLKTLAEAKELQEFKIRFQKVISHELRTPLAGVKMSSDIVERYMESLTKEELYYHTKEINASVREIEVLLDNMLLTMKVETQTLKTDFTRCDVVELCRKEVESLMKANRNTRTIEFASASEHLPLLLDNYLMHIILRNILTNALNYSHESSVVHLWVGLQHGKVCITVHDSGIGILPEDLNIITQPFFRGKNVENIPGIGMGLFVAQHCVELHEGILDVQSTPNKETIVTVMLPTINA